MDIALDKHLTYALVVGAERTATLQEQGDAFDDVSGCFMALSIG